MAGPRRRSSSAAITAMAWIFGAPVIEAGGKAARSRSAGARCPARSRPRTVETVWWSVGRRHQLGVARHLDAAGLADAAEVVARHVHDHRQLGAVLLALQQLAGEGPVLARIGAARPGALDRPRLDLAVRARRGTAPGEIESTASPASRDPGRRRARPGSRRAAAGRAARRCAPGAAFPSRRQRFIWKISPLAMRSTIRSTAASKPLRFGRLITPSAGERPAGASSGTARRRAAASRRSASITGSGLPSRQASVASSVQLRPSQRRRGVVEPQMEIGQAEVVRRRGRERLRSRRPSRSRDSPPAWLRPASPQAANAASSRSNPPAGERGAARRVR